MITGTSPVDPVESKLPGAMVKEVASPDEALATLRDGQIDTIAGGALWSKVNRAAFPGCNPWQQPGSGASLRSDG